MVPINTESSELGTWRREGYGLGRGGASERKLEEGATSTEAPVFGREEAEAVGRGRGVVGSRGQGCVMDKGNS